MLTIDDIKEYVVLREQARIARAAGKSIGWQNNASGAGKSGDLEFLISLAAAK